ncbi:MAG: TIGR03016 family PEP-CTERM system-associated outer membrane protein [Gallionellaceae bacterium]|nr:TIGR03016 family PEP-CTERM system-associated outer membrane protein [Gallionellaceae bacterium]
MASTLPSNNALLRPSWILLWVLPVTAFAASDWKVTSGLSLSERYTDNVSLAANGGQSAFITQVAPRIGISRQGKRGSVNIAYSLSDLLYDSGQNNLSQDLNATMQVEPVAGVFKLNGNARVGQQYASQFAPVSLDAYHTVANRVETRSVSLTPSLHNELFERSLITDASLGLNYASAGSNTLGNSTSNTLKLSLRNGPRPERFTYGANYSRNSGNSSGVSASTFESESYNIGYAIYSRTRVFLNGGRNSTQGVASLQGLGSSYTTVGANWTPVNYFSLTGTAGQSGNSTSYSLSGNWSPSRKLNLAATAGKRNNASSYNLSGLWTPSALTSLSASAQKNFDGGTFGVDTTNNGLSSYGSTSYALKLNHRIRRAAVGLSYTESVVDASQQLNQTTSFPYYLCGTEFKPVVPGEAMPSGCLPVTVTVPFTQILNQTTYNKTWAGTLNYSLGRSALAFSLSQSKRQSLSTTAGGEDQQMSVAASWSMPLSGRTSTTLGTNWSTAEAATQQSDTWSLNWSLARQISPHVSSSVTARHSEQKTNGTTGNVKENSVSAQLGMTF